MRSDDAQSFLSPMLNTGEEKIDKQNRDTRIARYKSTKTLLFDYMEDNSDRVSGKSRIDALDVGIGLLAAVIGL